MAYRHRWADKHRTYGSWRSLCTHCGIVKDERFAYGMHCTEFFFIRETKDGTHHFYMPSGKTPDCSDCQEMIDSHLQYEQTHRRLFKIMEVS